MTLKDIITAIPQGWFDLGAGAIILGLIQISPVKLEPWTWLKAFFSMPHRIKAVEEKIAALEEKDEENMAIQSRVRILRFADEVSGGHPRGYESYKQTFLDIDRYRRYCDKHPDFKNEASVAAIHTVREEYEKHRKARDFYDMKEDNDVAKMGA